VERRFLPSSNSGENAFGSAAQTKGLGSALVSARKRLMAARRSATERKWCHGVCSRASLSQRDRASLAIPAGCDASLCGGRRIRIGNPSCFPNLNVYC
jgi:hypothetical protein